MILKIYDQRQGKEQNHVFDVWNYFDNIVSASCYFDEGSKTTVVRCTFRDESIITFSIPYVAYLMSDTGKTVEKIEGAPVESEGDTELVYPTLHEAADAARKESNS